MSDKIRLGIGLPAYGGRLAMWHMDMWLSMGYALATNEERFQLVFRDLVDVCGVEVARNKLFDQAMGAKVDWLLMVDADTWHPDGFEILQLISNADRAGAAVVALPTPRRGGNDTHLMAYECPTPNERVPMSEAQIRGRTDSHGLSRVDAVATSFMAVNLKFVEERLTAPWFRFVWIEGTTRFVSEDLDFCRRVREADGKIYVSAKLRARHLNRPELL